MARPTGQAEASHRYGLVLALVVADFLFTTAAPTGGLSRLCSVALSGAVLLAALRASGAGPGRRRAGLVLVTVAVLAATLVDITGGGRISRGVLGLTNGVLIAAAPLAITRGLLRSVMTDGVTGQVVAGALAIYLLIGMLFGFLVIAVSDFADGPYFAGRGSTTASDDVYFSFITLSTVGYGDYTPVLGIGRALSVLEGVTGQLYLVTVVALLVSNLRRRREDPPEREARLGSEIPSEK